MIRAPRRLAVFAVLAAAVGPAVAQEGPHLPIGPWHGNYQLSREDPRIRTRGGADLIRMQVIHSKGQPTATVSWIAGRAICEDPLAEPCEWIGANGTQEARVVGDTLVLALSLSPDESDPAILVLERRAQRGQPARYYGVMSNAKADWGYRFTASAE